MKSKKNFKIYLGIDIGTSKICVLALNSYSIKPVEIISEKNFSVVKTEKDFSEQDPKIIKQITFDLINKIRKKIKFPISGIGITGQMHGMLFVDKNLKPLSNLITWQDKRSKNLIEEIQHKTKGIEFSECGCYIKPGYMGSTLYWFYKNNLVPKNIYKVCFIHDWLGACLTQHNEIFTDPTDAASSGIFNIKKMDWHWNFIEKLRIKKEIFPTIKNSGEIIGFTKEGIPVACAFGDNQASIFGSVTYNNLVADSSGSVIKTNGSNFGKTEMKTYFENNLNKLWRECIIINIGTGSQVSVILDKFVKFREGLELRPYIDGKYILVGASLNGGSIYSVLKDFFITAGKSFWKIKQENIFETMNKLASKIPFGCDGLVCEPYFFGERINEELKASFVGLDINNFTVSHFCKAILEGMIRILYNYYKSMKQNRKYIIGSGNAIKRNEVLQKIIKQTFNMELKLNLIDEEAAYGAALLSFRRDIQC